MKQNLKIPARRPTIGYTWVSKAGCWQVYQHFNSSATDKIEWVDGEMEAKERAHEIEQLYKGGDKI